MRRFMLALVLSVLSVTPVFAASINIEASFKEGQQAYSESRFDDAASSFSLAAKGLMDLKQFDKAKAVYNNVAIIRMKQEQWQKALDIYKEVANLPGKTPADLLLKITNNTIVCAEKTNQHSVKADAITRLLQTKPTLSPKDAVNFYAMQGDAYRACELYRLAAQAYQAALKQKEISTEQRLALLTGLGLSQGNLGQFPVAIATLEKALAEAEKTEIPMPLAESTSNIGILHWESGQYEKAEQMLLKALDHEKKFKLRRNEGVDNNNLALVYKNAGRLVDARSRVEQALTIAREVKNLRDEAIALSNRALLVRLDGDVETAKKDYAHALELYTKVGFREGVASTLMGLARIEMDATKNYPASLEMLEKAAAIYEELENPGFLAEAYVQLGSLYQKIATPGRKTRDLVFEEETPTLVDMPKNKALDESSRYFALALPLAEKTVRREIQWGAMHGLAFAAKENGQLEKAEELYSKAIAIVLSMKGGESNPELLNDFLRDKDDLFAQAIDVCAKLYAKTKSPELLKKQMQYDETYRNEVMRANMQMANLSYVDPKKKELYSEIVRLSASKKKAETASAKASNSQSEFAVQDKKQAEKEASLIAKEFEQKLALWKKQYPQDAAMFDSFATVDTVSVQKSLTDDQAIIQYVPLEDTLIIIVITKNNVHMETVPVSYTELASLIRDKFIAENIEVFGRGNMDEKLGYDRAIALCETLANYLYTPISSKIADKQRLFFVTSKYLSYIPFSALVVGKQKNGKPVYLIEEKVVSLSRLAFFDANQRIQKHGELRDVLIVGNPSHEILSKAGLAKLPGAEKEAINAEINFKSIFPSGKINLLLKQDATETTWKELLEKEKYDIVYFATHGVPYAEVLFTMYSIREKERKGEKVFAGEKKYIEFFEKNRQSKSHLNGFLFMAYPDERNDGLLTLKEILEIPDNSLKNATLAILSACNTAVSYAPKVLLDKNIGQQVQEELESSVAQKNVSAAGWTPGVDQVSLLDTFMRRNFRNIYATLWFADDTASSIIMTNFVKGLENSSPAESLRDAQLAYLQSPPKGLGDYPTHPYFWACGNIFGQ